MTKSILSNNCEEEWWYIVVYKECFYLCLICCNVCYIMKGLKIILCFHIILLVLELTFAMNKEIIAYIRH